MVEIETRMVERTPYTDAAVKAPFAQALANAQNLAKPAPQRFSPALEVYEESLQATPPPPVQAQQAVNKVMMSPDDPDVTSHYA